MLAPQVAADPAGEGDFVGVSTSRRVQVRTLLFRIIQSSQLSTAPWFRVQILTSIGCHVYPYDLPARGGIRDTRASPQRLSQTTLSWHGCVVVLYFGPALVHVDIGGYSLTYMDEFVDQLLTEERVCDLILPRLTKRDVLEDLGDIGPRKSRLLDAMEGRSEHGSEKSRSRSRSSDRSRSRSPRRAASKSRSRSRSPSRGRSPGSKSRSPSPTGSRYVSRSRSGSRSPYRSRSRSISPDRANGSASGSPERFRSRSRSISPDRMDTS